MSQNKVALNWISLSEYSNEYGVSVSTLRRRIKNDQVDHRMINGKYFLPDKVMKPKVPTPVPNGGLLVDAPAKESSFSAEVETRSKIEKGESSEVAKILLEELKKAYLNSLQDKEKNIIQLKQQVADLKTLVLYLEKENKRLGGKLN